MALRNLLRIQVDPFHVTVLDGNPNPEIDVRILRVQKGIVVGDPSGGYRISLDRLDCLLGQFFLTDDGSAGAGVISLGPVVVGWWMDSRGVLAVPLFPQAASINEAGPSAVPRLCGHADNLKPVSFVLAPERVGFQLSEVERLLDLYSGPL